MENTIKSILEQHRINEETSSIIKKENLLPLGLLNRLHANYPEYSGIKFSSGFLFTAKNRYTGLAGFREIIAILNKAGVDIGHIEERELFINVYRFMVTRHVLNSIDWQHFENDSLFLLVFPQPGMIKPEALKKYKEAKSEKEKEALIAEYIQKNTNPHDGKQKLNKPWFENEDGELVILEGSQHKYLQCQLIFDKTTQNCFSFCTYCFRHAQVRGDEDMFIQENISAVHGYLKKNKGVTDVLLTGGDAGLMPFERLRAYAEPLIHDPDLMHIKTLRIGSRALTYDPEMILTKKYDKFLELFKTLRENGIQVVWMAHFCTPRELLNPKTIAAIRRLQLFGVAVKSQSPIMNHVSLFTDENGKTDVDRSAQNWIDLANIFAVLSVGFHSMYCARPTGEHHYFTVPLADINKVFSKIYRSLPSINRPSRYISMTSSAGKTSILGTVEVNGKKAFALKFNESRNMEWMDQVYLARYDEKENTVIKLLPFKGDKFFYEDELEQIEKSMMEALEKRMKKK
jgi:L-lysine 2,3-aminomutase